MTAFSNRRAFPSEPGPLASISSRTPPRSRPYRLPPVSCECRIPSLRSSSASISRQAPGQSLTLNFGLASVRRLRHLEARGGWLDTLAREGPRRLVDDMARSADAVNVAVAADQR